MPAQAERDRRHVALEEAGVADDRDVGGEALALRREPRVEVDRARFLLALEHVLDVDRAAAARREQRLGGHQVGVDLALVVGCAAGQHPVADDDRLERRRGPQLERVDRLDVVVAVDEDRRGAGGVEPVGVDDRVAAGLGDLDVLEAGRRPARRRATRRRAGSRRRARAAPRCSGSAGTPCTTRGGVGVGRVEVGLEGGVGRRACPALYGRRTDGRPWNRTSGPSPARSSCVALAWSGDQAGCGFGSGIGLARADDRSGCRGCPPWAAGR